MTVDTPSPRARGLRRTDSLPSNTRLNKSPTRSQGKEARIPKKHHNIFDQTLLPEEDFSGGKLLRRRKTSGPHDFTSTQEKSEPAPPSSAPIPKSTNNSFDEIQVSSRPKSRPSIAVTPSSPLSSSQTLQREFRVRDKKVDYTIPSLKSLLPSPPRQQRRSSAPPLTIPRIRSQQPNAPSTLPRETEPARPRTITNRSGEKSLLMKLRISANKLEGIINRAVQPRIRIVESASRKRRLQEEEEALLQPRGEEKPFGGILTKEDADTFRQTPTEIDRARFERAKEKSTAAQNSITVARSASEVPSSVGPITETAFRIRAINFGNYRVKTHYASPYPEEYSRQSVLGICEFCLKYMTGEWVGWRHRCPVKHPPGDEIYRDGKISIFEVDGRKNPVYCQNLCLLAKMYLDHKTLYYDVEPFLFYVVCECDDRGCHFVGYFSKEKRSMAGYNLSCIVTLPIYQRKGYGFFLISFSYLLSQRENRLGSPEKPLSDLGLLSYRSYWKTALAIALLEVLDHGANVSIQDLGRRTGMTDDDVISGLEGLDSLVRDPETGVYAVRVVREKLLERVELVERKGYVKVKEELLKWTPYLLGRKEAKELLEGGLDALIRQRTESADGQLWNTVESTESEDVKGTSIPPERFVSVAVKDLFRPQIAYHTTGSQTPGPIPSTPGVISASVSVTEDDDDEPMDELEDEPLLSSPSSPSLIDEDISDEPYSAEEEIDEDPSEEEMSDYLSDDSNDFNPRKRRRLTRPSHASPKLTPEVVVRVKQVAKAPRSRAALGAGQDTERRQPRVIAAKAPRSRAGRNPPEVMARRTSLRRV